MTGPNTLPGPTGGGSRPRVLFYCQHVLGIGHFSRSIEIVKGLSAFDVCFLNGGNRIQDFELPAGVEFIDLPPMRSDADFRRIETSDGALDLELVKEARKARILETCERIRPDIAVIELFPFGRRKFAFEIVPMLERCRRMGARIACSLRDIVVGKDDQARFEERTRRLIDKYFDFVLVHSDPCFQRLEETFESIAQLTCAVHYTGFVMQAPPRQMPSAATPVIVVSIGGGRVGGELLECAIRASALIEPERPHRMLAFSGPFVTEEDWGRAMNAATYSPSVTLERFNPKFLDCLAGADLSISMAGYNTCMNIVATGVRALVHPFTGGDNTEQTVRARKLESVGAVSVLGPSELTPKLLADRILRSLDGPAPPAIALDTNGVSKTAELLTASVARPIAHARNTRAGVFQQLGRARQGAQLFLRDDDTDVMEDTLTSLLDICCRHRAAITLAAIPGKLTTEAAAFVRERIGADRELVEVHQHGWMHVNHEPDGKKCEFGPGRTFEQQLRDIAEGKARMQEMFGSTWFPGFTPPWNRCTEDTCRALEELGFSAVSTDAARRQTGECRLRQIPVTIDIYRWKGSPVLRPAEEIVREMILQMEQRQTIGILLHHKIMDAAAFAFLDELLEEICSYGTARFYTFRALAGVLEAQLAAKAR